MLRNDIARYTELSGNDGEHTPIGIVGAFLDGYETGLKDRPKGHWIMTNDYLTCAYGSIDYVKCSCCGEDSLEEGDYCPNCGADMRGKADEDNH